MRTLIKFGTLWDMQKMFQSLNSEKIEFEQNISFFSNQIADSEKILNKVFKKANLLKFENFRLNKFKFEKKIEEIENLLKNNALSDINVKKILEYNLKIDGDIVSTENVLYSSLFAAIAIISLKETKPNLVLIKGGTRPLDAALFHYSQLFEIPVLVCERGPFPNSLTLSTNIGPLVFDGDVNLIENSEKINDFVFRFKKNNESAWEQPDPKSDDYYKDRYKILEESVVCLFAGQVNDDANMQIFSPKFNSTQEVFNCLINETLDIPNLIIIAKPHPKEGTDLIIPDGLDRTRNIYIDRDLNIKDAFNFVDVLVTNNSTSGFEALLYDVPVITTGESFYDSCNYVIKYSQSLTFFKAISQIHLVKNKSNDAYLFANFILREFCFFYNAEDNLNGPKEFCDKVVKSSRAYRDLISDYDYNSAKMIFSYYHENLRTNAFCDKLFWLLKKII